MLKKEVQFFYTPKIKIMNKRSNPNNLRLGIQKDWVSNWFSDKSQFFSFLQNDFIIYKFFYYHFFFKEKLLKIRIIRFSKKTVLFFLLINQKKIIFKNLNLNPVLLINKNTFLIFNKEKKYKSNSFFIATKIAILIENRINFRSLIIKKIINDAFLTKSILVFIKGRINNVEMSKNDFLGRGSIPFQQLKKKIDFSFVVANTIKGCLSVKVWCHF